jgi:hypothetical protein
MLPRTETNYTDWTYFLAQTTLTVKSKDKAGNLSKRTSETIRTKPSAPTNSTSFNNYIIINSFNLDCFQ